MREILFRGKRKADGQWVLGAFCPKNSQGRPCIIDLTSGYWYPIDPESIGQWTGLVDVNGVKVFEGDIVKLRTDQDIGHEFPCKRCIIEFDEYHRFVAVTPSRLVHPLANRYEWEVISNIHDKAVEE